MPNQVTVNVPAPIIVQVKQVEKTEVTSPAFTAGQSRLAKLLDVNISNESDGTVLYYNAANGDYEFSTIDGERLSIQIRRSNTPGEIPSSLANGELFLNFTDQLLYYKHANGSIITLANGAAIGIGTDAYARIRANAAFEVANGSAQLSFVTLNVAGQNNIVADSSSDTLILVSGAGIIITTDAANDSVTITANVTSSTDQFARDQANAAFNEANTADVLAQSAFNQANVATSNADAAFAKANTANTLAQGAFNQANVATTNADAAFTHSNAAFVLATTANTVAVAAYVQANIATTNADAAFSEANVADVLAQSAFNQANTANVTGQAAFDKANGSVQTGFVTVSVDGQNNVVADSNTDTLTLVQGFGILLSTNSVSDTVTISASSGKSYYLNYTNTADVAGYHTAPILPSPNPENVVVTLCTTALSFNLVGSFITANGEPNINLLPPGLYGRHIHATTDGSNSIARLRFELYKRAANNLETLLRTNDSPDFSSADPEVLLSWNITDPVGFPLETTDRFVFKLYAARVSGGSGSINVTIYFEGQNRASYITTTILNSGGVSTVAGRQGDVVLNTNDVTENAAGPYYFTAARVRANISNTSPINYDPAAGTISHALSGVGATTYGNTTFVSQVTVDDKGHVTSASNVAIAFPPDQYARDKANGAAQLSFVTLNVAGQNNVVADSNSDTLTLVAGASMVITTDAANDTITFSSTATGSSGNSFTTFNVAGQSDVVADSNNDTLTLVGGTGITLTTDAPNDTITIALTGSGAATDSYAREHANGAFDKANGAAQLSFVTLNVAGQNNVVADSNSDTLILVAGAGILITTDAANDTVTFIANVTSSTDQFARDQANGAFAQANIATTNADAAFAHSNGAIYTATQIRANISNTAPINYDSSTGVISHAVSGVTASGYGDAATVPKIVVDVKGHVTGVTNTAIAISAAAVTSGTLLVARGGTGQTAVTVNGSLLIGNTVSSGFDVNPLTPGPGIQITNDKGSITITANVTSATDQFARDQANGAFAQANIATTNADAAFAKANGAAQLSFVTLNVAGQNNVVADSNSDTLILVAGAGIVITTDAPNDTITLAATGIDQYARDKANVATVNADAAFAQANIATTNADAAFTHSNAAFVLATTANTTAAAALAQATIATTNADAAFTHANAAFVLATTANTVAAAAFVQANIATVNADAAFIKANGAAQLSFVTLNVAGQNNVVADSNSDTLILVAGAGIVITTDAPNDTITLAATGVDQLARDEASAAFAQANIATTNADAAFAHSNGAIYTAAQIRANISNTAPINYDAANGILSHALSGVTASGYGDVATVAKVAVDSNGHVTAVTNTAIAISASAVTSGTLAVARGGTGQTAITVPGALLIANQVSGGFDVNAITQGTGAVITNANGSITIAAAVVSVAGRTGTVVLNTNDVTENAAGPYYFTAARVRANISNTAPINYDSSTGIISHAISGVTAGGYPASPADIPFYTVDDKGHLSASGTTPIAISAAAVTSGTLAVARGGTGQTAITVPGALLIANQVSGGFDVNTITQGTNITITNGNGSISIAAAGGSGGNSFATINVAGQTNVVANSNNTTLTLVAGSGMTITTDTGNDKITFVATATGTGNTNSKQTEINFGTVPISSNTYIITDASVVSGSFLMGSVAYVAPTGKDLDELDMDEFDLKFAPGSGQFTLYIKVMNDGLVAGNVKINYTVG